MSVYMIGYDLHPKFGETYTELHNAIMRVSGLWWHRLDSTWVVSTPKTAVQVRDELLPHIRVDDQLFVVKLEKWWAGYGLKDNEVKWLNDHVSQQ